MSTARVNVQERYDVSREIGAGAMGTVYLARDRVIDRQVVLKTLRDPLLDGEESSQRLIDEARSAGRINHPNVVTVYDVLTDQDTGRLYLALEYVEGRTLSQILAHDEKLSVENAAMIVLQIAAGLQHLHDAGLIHRDIKPSNILVDDRGLAKITDFGIARAAGPSQLEQDGTVFGTPPYMAPEQLLGLELDARADVYSLGAVFYEMVSGRKPIDAQSVTGVARGTLRAEVRPLKEVAPHVPAAVRAVVERAMAREASSRFASMNDFAAAIRAATGVTATIELPSLGPGSQRGTFYVPTVPLPGRRLLRLRMQVERLTTAPWAVRLRIGVLGLLLAVAVGSAIGWWLFEQAAGPAVDPASDMALETRSLQAVLLREGHRLLREGDAQSALTVAALAERLAPGSAASSQLWDAAQDRAREEGLPDAEVESVGRSVEDPVGAARDALGNSRQAAELSAAIARITEARERDARWQAALARLDREKEAEPQPALAPAPSLEIQVDSQVPRGTVVVFADGRQIFNREFAFGERKNAVFRRGTPGEFKDTVELEPGDYDFMVYVMRRRERARLTRLAASLGEGETLRLAIEIPQAGEPHVTLR